MKQKIIDFLNLHHKRAWCMDDRNYDYWIVEALNNSDKGWKHIELKSYESPTCWETLDQICNFECHT